MIAKNESLDVVLDKLTDTADCTFRERVAVKVCQWRPRKRQELQRALTERAMETGAIAPSSVEDGVYVGDWRDLWDWIWEHREEIFEFVITIISLF